MRVTDSVFWCRDSSSSLVTQGPRRRKRAGLDPSRNIFPRIFSTCGDDTDTELAGIDDDDESPSDVEAKLPTFSMVRTLHESVDVVRIASFPPPPVVESATKPTAVDWNAATPPIEDWPRGIPPKTPG